MKIGEKMQMCPDCDKVYDESEYGICPYCSGELVIDDDEEFFKNCPVCGGIMYWDEVWVCSNCSHEIISDKDDFDGVIS